MGSIVTIVLFVIVAAVAAVFIFDIPMPWLMNQAHTDNSPPQRLGVQLAAEMPNTLVVPTEVRETLGIRLVGTDRLYNVAKPTRSRALVMPGSTALDPGRLYPIRVRFAPCETVEIAKVPDTNPKAPSALPETWKQGEMRELRNGDWIKKGQVLCVCNSVDVGQQKNALIDALSQLNLDERILDEYDKARGALPEYMFLQGQRAIEADHNNVDKALYTLKAWNIPKQDIDACYKQADEIIKRRGKRDHNADDLHKWARVEIRAPEDGVIIERNVAEHVNVIDNTVNLFQIAKVDRLSVFAHVPEDEVPTLEALPTAERRWTVKTVGSEPVPGMIDDVGYIIDPNTHTALVKGHIDNPREVLRAGQFISATVELPPPPDVVEVPADTVVEDGQTSVVFVQDKDHKDHFTMRRVQPTARFDKTIFIRSRAFAKAEQRTAEEEELGILPKEPLLPGERILTSGVGELKAALLDLQSQQKTERKEAKDK
jgi:cobalt-zinc-cadmium efflux system membrane fusion protein